MITVPAPKTIKIEITEELLKESTENDSRTCMIAQALRLKGATSTHVTAESASFNMGDYRFTYPLPAKAAVQLKRFDKDKNSINPFAFTLFGRTAFVRPVIRYPDRKKRGPTKSKRECKRSPRRFHGLRVLEVSTQ